MCIIGVLQMAVLGVLLISDMCNIVLVVGFSGLSFSALFLFHFKF